MKTLFAFLLLTATAVANEVCIEAKLCRSGSCEVVRGTGVVAHHDPAKNLFQIVTARHVVEGTTDAKINTGEGWLAVQSVHWLGQEDDFAVLVVKYSGQRLSVTPISETDAKPGEPIRWSGFSGGQQHETMEGQAREVGTIGFAKCQTRCKEGQSGGGVYNDSGEVIGWVKGYNPENGELIYTPVCHIRRRCAQRWGWFFGLGIGGWVEPAPPFRRTPQPRSVDPGPKPADPSPLPSAPPPPVEKPQPPVSKPAQPPVNYQSQIDSLNTEIARLKALKIPVQILNPDGSVFDEATYQLGHPIKLKLSPKAK
jgi:hypothetical protein